MNAHTLNEIKSIAISYTSEGYENTLVASITPHLVEGEVMLVTGGVWHSPVDPVQVSREFSMDYLLEELRLLKNESTLQHGLRPYGGRARAGTRGPRGG